MNGNKISQLGFNMTGYIGSLMGVHGNHVFIGESGISAYKKEIAMLNREAKESLAENHDRFRMTGWTRTADWKTVKLNFKEGPKSASGVEDSFYVPVKTLKAALELMRPDEIRRDFFKTQDPIEEPPSDFIKKSMRQYGNNLPPCYTLGIFDTTDEDIVAVAVGSIPAHLVETITMKETIPNPSIAFYSANAPEQWAERCENITFISRDTMAATIAAHGGDFMPVQRLYGGGMTSERKTYFSEVFHSTHSHPTVQITNDFEAGFVSPIEELGYKTSFMKMEAGFEAGFKPDIKSTSKLDAEIDVEPEIETPSM